MSGIAAVYGRLSADALQDVLQTLLDAIERRGPLASSWTGDGIALGQRLLPTTPEARYEGLPQATLGGRYKIALDGRIDNRRDMINALALQDPDVAVLTDADIIIHAYDRWGTACLEHLLGNFAFVLWDEAPRRLFAARDHQGFRSLVYARTAGGLAIGSEPRQLLALPGIRDEVDQEFLACFLSNAVPRLGATPYKFVSEVPPAHYLLADESGIVVREYWRLRPPDEINLKRREDYVEMIDAAMQEAVGAALRRNRGAAVLLSGGLDSSYVASIAAEIDPSVRAINAYSETYDKMDERRYSRAVTDRLGMDLTEINADECWSLSSAMLPDETIDDPNVAVQGSLFRALASAGAAQGEDVLLDGAGGDECFTGTSAYLGILLTQGRLIRAFNEARTWSKREKYPFGLLLKNNALMPLIPVGLRGHYRALRGRQAMRPLPCWLDERVIRQLGLDRALDLPPGNACWDKEASYRRFWNVHRRDMAPLVTWRERWAASPLGIDLRSPFWDLRIVTITARIPEWVHRDAGRTKALARAAMKQRLPEMVTARRDYGIFNQLINKGLFDAEVARVERALNGPLKELPYINVHLLKQELDDLRLRGHPWWHQLWRAITAGLWLDLNSVSRGHMVDRLKNK